MEAPPTKKHKTEDPKKVPIVFKASGIRPDTRLVVFDREFHVHSTILTLYSAFFRKALSQTKERERSTPGFKYDFASKIDSIIGYGDQIIWTLIPPGEQMVCSRVLDRERWLEDETRNLFHTLLKAMYNHPYELEDLNQLEKLVQLAEQYGCLPILSRTINSTLLSHIGDNDWYCDILDRFVSVLETASKLRSSILFKDAMILSVSEANFDGAMDSGLSIETRYMKPQNYEIMRNAYHSVALKACRAHNEILQKINQNQEGHDDKVSHNWVEMISKHSRQASVGGKFFNATYFHGIAKDIADNKLRNMKFLPALLKCNLALLPNQIPGDRWTSYLLCADIDDKDLPWDPKETDW